GTGREPKKSEPLDRFLGQLQHKEAKVHELAARHIQSRGQQHNVLHEYLLQLFVSPDRVRLVTTNFDQLFESAARSLWGSVPEVFRAPALPLGRSALGLLYLHGIATIPDSLVLTDMDFGRAYLTD